MIMIIMKSETCLFLSIQNSHFSCLLPFPKMALNLLKNLLTGIINIQHVSSVYGSLVWYLDFKNE